MNLLATAARVESWKIDPSIPWLVLLATDDSYVDADATIGLLEEHAPHFQRKSYANARHKLDNETMDVADDVHSGIIQFSTGF